MQFCRPRLHLTLATAAVLAVALFPALAEARRPAKPVITSVRCWPIQSCGSNPHVVAPGGRLRFRGRNLQKKGMLVIFRGRAQEASGGAGGPRALTAKLRLKRPDGFVVSVPVTAHSGRIRIRGPHGVRSNVVGPISVRKPVPRNTPLGGPLSGTAFDGSGMWIWYVSKSSGGSVPAIVAQAQQYGVEDRLREELGRHELVGAVQPDPDRAAEGGRPARLRLAVRLREEPGHRGRARRPGPLRPAPTAWRSTPRAQYEGLYAQAQTYIQDLRAAVGPNFPVSLASFPYIDYHPALPLLRLPRAGRRPVQPAAGLLEGDRHEPRHRAGPPYQWNTVYGRPIVPLGQLYNGPSAKDVQRFRALAAGYGASGVSWWSWQSASQTGWTAIAPPDPVPAAVLPLGYPLLKSGSKGDVVVWAQEHLITAGAQISATGKYDTPTAQSVSAFQAAHGLPVNGTVDQATWTELLKLAPAPVSWASKARAASAGRRNGPSSAHLRARRDEIPPRPPG